MLPLHDCGPDLPEVRLSYRLEEKTWILSDTYRIRCDGVAFSIPSGFRFDLATVPRFFWGLIAPYELSIVAPLIHDFLYEYDGHPPEGTVDPPRTFTRLEADRLFLALMRARKVPLWKRWLAFLAVRIFGGFYWKAKQGRREET